MFDRIAYQRRLRELRGLPEISPGKVIFYGLVFALALSGWIVAVVK